MNDQCRPIMTAVPPELEGLDQMPDDRAVSRIVGERARVVRTNGTQHSCITAMAHTYHFRNATASASDLGTHWWIDRVWICPDWRRKGLGRFLVLELLAMVKARGGKRIIVAPGGYNMRYRDQRAFYESCGFAEFERGAMEIVW